MTREEALELARHLEVAVNRHDTRQLIELYADDAVTKTPMFPHLKGRAAICSNWEKIFSLFPDWTVRIEDVLVDGDRVAFTGIASATDRSGWFGQPATGERIEYRALILLTMAQGKIVRDERIYDLAGVLERLEKARLDKELRMAADVQRALLSRREHSTSYCEAVGDSLPCRAIGGDFFELADLPSGDFAIALGDVAGKGPASALLAAMIQGMLAVEVASGARPGPTLGRLNRLLLERGLEPRFASLVFGILSADGSFVYANAGHNPPLILSSQGLKRLDPTGPILGAFWESSFEQFTVRLREGDTIVMFTDGVTEARNGRGEELSEARFVARARAFRTDRAPRMLEEILEYVEDFSRGATQADDITVAVTRFRRL